MILSAPGVRMVKQFNMGAVFPLKEYVTNVILPCTVLCLCSSVCGWFLYLPVQSAVYLSGSYSAAPGAGKHFTHKTCRVGSAVSHVLTPTRRGKYFTQNPSASCRTFRTRTALQ